MSSTSHDGATATSTNEDDLPPYTPTERPQFATIPGRPDPGYKWGKTPGPFSGTHRQEVYTLPPDHPVHRYSEEELTAMRKKRINPVLKAEMDAAVEKPNGRKSKLRSLLRGSAGFGMGFGG